MTSQKIVILEMENTLSLNAENRSELLYYNKEKDEEIENKILCAYELFDSDDLDNRDKLMEEERNSFTNKNNKNYDNKRSHTSVDNFFSKKTTTFSNPLHISGQFRDLYDANLNIVKSDNNDLSVRDDKRLNLIGRPNRENLIKQLMAMDFKKEPRQVANSVRSANVPRSKTSEGRMISKDYSTLFGERLYYKGLAIKEKSSKNLLQMKIWRKNEEMKECTFRPKLSHSSIITNLKAAYSKEAKYSTVLKTNYVDTCYSTSSFNSNRRRNEGIDLNKISNSSRKNEKTMQYISSYKEHSESCKSKRTKTEYELIQYSSKLYNDAMKIKMNKEKLVKTFYEESCPFQPKIKDQTKPDIQNFFFRLQKWVDKRNEKYETDIDKANYDEKTGLRLFSPQVTKRSNLAKEYGLNESNRNKFLELYNNWKQKEARVHEKQELYNQDIKLLSNIPHIVPKSRELTNELINKIFSKMFEFLVDPDSNVINGNKINLNLLPDKMRKMLFPLVNELKEQNETLSVTEFIVASNHLYNFLPPNEKQYLFEWYFSLTKKKHYLEENFTFKPAINKKSEKIATTSSVKYASNFYLKAIDTLQNKEQKLKEESERKNKQRNLEVTFRPRVIRDCKSNYSYRNSHRQLNLQSERKMPSVNQEQLGLTEANEVIEIYEENLTAL